MDSLNFEFIFDGNLTEEAYKNSRNPGSDYSSLWTKLQFGDICIFGHQNETDFKKFHLAIFLGIDPDNSQPNLIHASYFCNGVTIWPLIQFFKYPSNCLKAVKRLKSNYARKL